MIDAGYLIEFIDKNQISLALVQNAKKGRLSLLTAQDKQVALPDSRALLAHASKLNPGAPRAALAGAVAEIEARRDELAGQVDVPELWELVHAEEQNLSIQQLAELAFNPPVGHDQVSATLRAIFNERVHFRLNNKNCEPLSPAQLEQKQIQQQREAEKKARQELYLGWLNANSIKPENAPAELVEMLEDWVVRQDDSPYAKQVKELAGQAELGSRKKVFDLLVRIGRFKPHQNLAALREQLPGEFALEIVEQARHIKVLEQGYQWLDMELFTIDGEETDDFDDALSFVARPDGSAQLGIYITSLQALEPGGALDLEARQRATTLYLPDERVSMLPPHLSTDVFSLRAGEVRPVVGCLVELNPQAQVMGYQLGAYLVKVKQRLTYNEVDKRLAAGDSYFGRMHQLCLALNQQREQAGACFLPLPEVNIEVDENWQVVVEVVERDGPAREMVAETAILANRLQGEFMRQNNIACLYRVQAAPKEPWENAGAQALYTNFSRRRLLQRVEISLNPGLHAGLGINSYTHATSPIRRYLDVLVQRQLLAHLQASAAPLDGPGLLEAAGQADVPLRTANRVRMARQRYWLLQWLKQRQGQVVPALVLEQQMRGWQILLKPIMLLANIPGISKNLAAGQEVEVKILRADPFDDLLRLELA